MTMPFDGIARTMDGRVWIAISADEIVEVLRSCPSPTLIVKLLRAMKLADPDRASSLAESFGIVL